MLDSLYENIGGKIKVLAVITFFIEAIGAFIYGVVLVCDEQAGIGMLTLLLGPIIAYVASWFLYGLGELIESNCETRDVVLELLRNQKRNPTKQEEPISIVTKKPGVGVRATQAVAAGKWACACGRVNDSYVSTCVCGLSKHEAKQKLAEQENK